MPRRFQALGGRLLRAVRGLRPRWAWIALLLGLPWLLGALSCGGRAAGLGILSALNFWVAILVLGFLGLRWFWRRLLFKVSRRLWVILWLVSILPGAALAVLLLSGGWLTLGAQASRSMLGDLESLQAALAVAAAEPSDAAALQALKPLGRPRILRGTARPVGLPEQDEDLRQSVPQLVYIPGDGHGLSLRLHQREAGGWRTVALDLDSLGERSRRLLGGRILFRLESDDESPLLPPPVKVDAEEGDEDGKTDKTDKAGKPEKQVKQEFVVGIPAGKRPGRRLLAQWAQGEPLEGGGLFRSFRLPPVALSVVDGRTGEALRLKATPETDLVELLAGYGFGRGNRSEETLITMGKLVLLALALGSIQFTALLLGLRLARNLGRAVQDLSRGVSRLARADFGARIRVRGRDQMAGLGMAFNEMAQHLQAAQDERAERLRLEEELRVAREVQMRLLPDLAGLAPGIQACVLPAREVAGDYFDVMKLPDGRMAFLIADVSGKGTSAAFYAAEIKGVVAALDKEALGPVEVVERINAIWCGSHPRRIFLTLAYGTFDPRDGAFAFVRAGHPAAFLRRQDGSVERLYPRGLGVGLTDQGYAGHLELGQGRLGPGEALVLYTDGLSEAMDPQDELFGESRIMEALAQPGNDPQNRLLAAAQTFTGGRALEDDLTLLVIQG